MRIMILINQFIYKSQIQKFFLSDSVASFNKISKMVDNVLGGILNIAAMSFFNLVLFFSVNLIISALFSILKTLSVRGILMITELS